MSQSRQGNRLAFGAPGIYRIEVQGSLDANWSDRLGGMKITKEKQKEGTWVTTLFGRLPDQAALLGVQTALYELHLPLLSMERVGNEACPLRQ